MSNDDSRPGRSVVREERKKALTAGGVAFIVTLLVWPSGLFVSAAVSVAAGIAAYAITLQLVRGELGLGASGMPRLWRYLVMPGVHLLLVLVGPAYYAMATVGPEPPDANIGAGLGLLWTAGWGLPWSLWPWYARLPGNDTTEMIFVACAFLNVALFTLFMWWRWRLASRAHRTSADARDGAQR